MRETSLSFRTKVLVTVAAVGSTAAVAGLGTYSQFTDTTNVSSAVASGQIVITAGSTNDLTSGVSGMLAGDTHEMAFDLVNGSTGIGSFSLSAAGTSPGTALTQAGGLTVQVDLCSVAWSGTVTHTCTGGTQTAVLPQTEIASLSSPVALPGLDATNGATNHLLVTVGLPAGAANTLQGLIDTITWGFTATQRAGQQI